MTDSIEKRVFRGTVVIVLVGILAKISAFISEAVLAAYLGTNFMSDAYYMVSSVHLVLYPMLSVGIWKVFLPLYKEKITQGLKDQAFELTNKAISFFTLVSVAAVVFIVIFAAPLVSVIASGFTGDTKELCIRLVRISAPMYVFIIASALYASILQSHDKFLGSQIREVASHLPTILAAFFFYHRFGIEVMAVALVVGGVARLLVEFPFVDWGYKYKLNFKFGTKEFRSMLKRMPSALISEGVTQFNTLIDKAMASTLPEGTVSCLNYGHRLMNVFSGLISSAIATAMYPQMIELIAQKKEDELSRLVVRIINIFCLLMVPITVGCILFRNELVAIVFQRGAFDSDSTLMTSDVFALYCIGLFFIACNTVLSNLFYSYGNTRTPMFISIVNLATNVVLNIFLINVWGVNGLALATSISVALMFLIRMIAVKRYVKLDYIVIVRTGVKVVVSSLLACFIPRFLFWNISLSIFLTVLFSAMMGIVIYVITLKVFKVSEFDDVVILIRRKLNRKK